MNRRVGVAITLIAILYVAQGLYYARTLTPAVDGIQYLLIGSKVVRGEINVFDDRLHGNRAPLPFYVLGLSQVLAGGPSVLAARWMNIGFGLLALFLTVLLARRLAGDVAGILAALFFATQGVVVAYYAYEDYPAFAAFCFLGALSVFLRKDTPSWRILGMTLIGLLFFVRSNLWPAIPFFLAYALWRARGQVERALLIGVVTVPPLVFFAWDSRHLKILAYVPVLRRLVASLGYVSALVLDNRPSLAPAAQMWEAARLARRYEFWVLGTLVLLAVFLWNRKTGRPLPPGIRHPQVVFLAILLLYMLGAQFAIYSWHWRWVGFYFLPFAPLVPILLGVGFSEFLAATFPRSWLRRLHVIVLAGLLLPPLYFVRNPLLPIGELRAADPFQGAHRAAAHLARAVPRDAKVFFFGRNQVYYLSGLPHTYLQQVYSSDQFPRIQVDDWIVRRSGFVPASDMRVWLSREADYVVIDVPFLDHQRQIQPHTQPEEEMVALVNRYFERIDTVAEFSFNTYAVYRRKANDGRPRDPQDRPQTLPRRT